MLKFRRVVLWYFLFVAVFLLSPTGALGQGPCSPDLTPPTFDPINPNPFIAECGVPLADSYDPIPGRPELPRGTANDACDGVVTPKITDFGGLDLNNPQVGAYNLIYTATDGAGNSSTAVLMVIVVDTTPPVITPFTDFDAECGVPLSAPSSPIAGRVLLPIGSATDDCDGSITPRITDQGGLNLNNPQEGTYYITYTATDGAGNSSTAVLTVKVKDTKRPLITLIGSPWVDIPCGVTFTDPGAAAMDDCLGDIRSRITRQGEVNTASRGEYILRYNVEDNAGNKAHEVVRKVVVGANDEPVLTLNGNASVMIECGDTYTDPGATAWDACEGDISAQIITINPVKTSVPGTYTITYRILVQTSDSPKEKRITRTVRVVDTIPPIITLRGAPTLSINHGNAFVDPGATATDTCEGDITANIRVSGTVNTQVVGEYVLTYSVADRRGNSSQVARKVRVEDPYVPSITLNGPAALTIECGTVYVDAGATARELTTNTDISDKIEVTGLIPDLVGSSGAKVGTYVITYKVRYLPNGKETMASRTVTVMDTTAPVMILRGEASVTINCKEFYRDAGISRATDNCDGNLLSAVVQTGTVNTTMPGVYTITYSVKDKAGHTATVSRTITVQDNCSDTGSAEGEEVVGNVVVPNVINQTQEEAERRISNTNLKVGTVTYAYSNEVPEGRVISQSPEEGTIVNAQTLVHIEVSLGPACGCGEGNLSGDAFLGALALFVLLVISLLFGLGDSLLK